MSDPLVPRGSSRSEGLATHATRAIVAAITAALLLVVNWAVEIVDFMSSGRLDLYGILPRDVSGLDNIFTAPFLHYGFDHLMSNSIPLLVLGFFSALRGLGRFALVSLIIIVVSGLGVWLTAPPNSLTLGASGLIFGYFGYLLARGVLERRPIDILVAVVVVFLYGTMIFGVLPTQPGVSWQGHLFGLIGGVLAAWTLRRKALPALAVR